MVLSDHLLQGNASQSIHLLGQNFQESSSSLFKRYGQLREWMQEQGECLSFENSPEWISCYEKDAQSLHAKLPLLVFRPHSTASIAPFMFACHQLELPVTIRCGGTGLAGSCIASSEGVLLLTSHLRKINHYDSQKGKICLEPGVTARQLNQLVEKEGWFFPLSMATEGTAGLAGCLSSQARGYHQQSQALFDAIDSVTLVDGQGQICEVPSALVCGAEGLYGAITELKVQLKPQPAQRLTFISHASWHDLLTSLVSLRSLSALTFILWSEAQFFLGIEGEEWRMPGACHCIAKLLPDVKSLEVSQEHFNLFFLPNRKPFIRLSSVFSSLQLPEASQWAAEVAKDLALECKQQADVLAGSLHLILHAPLEPYLFSKKVEEFLVMWVDFVDQSQGQLASCQGIGMQLRPYMTPFWSEENQLFLRRLQAAFDSDRRLSKERFFPLAGRSLEKIRC